MKGKRRKTMKPKQKIESMRDLHKALGGTQTIATDLPTSKSAVAMWTTAGVVAGGHRLVVHASLRASGYRNADINPELFDLKDWSDLVLQSIRLRKLPAKTGKAA